jgi:Ser/Thr protein kinase RdoA (MazF antagonist)
MMKLRHLLDNRDLVLHLLQNWEYDSDQLEILNHYRISSNAIYPFYRDDKVCILRFAPISEKSYAAVKSEMEFMAYLKANDLSVPEPIPAISGEHLLLCDTPWGNYTAAAFHRVPGQRLDQMDLEAEFFEEYGKNLAKLHLLSRNYTPSVDRRATWNDLLEWAEGCLCSCEATKTAFVELNLLREALSELPVNNESFGLVHYDYELDNVFCDAQSGLLSTIDFDDSHYHWYGIDVERALANLEAELDEEVVPIAKANFIRGYQSLLKLNPDILAHFAVFQRYAGFMQYTRCLRAVYKHLDNEPEWMSNLRLHLEELIRKRESAFGTEL